MAAPDLFAAATARARAGRFAEALSMVEDLLGREPENAAAWAMRGSLEMELGRAADALASYDRASALRPGHAASEVNRANALNRLGRFEDALEGYQRAIAVDPGLAAAHGNRAQVLIELGRPAEALEAARAALALAPDYANGWTHAGAALHALGRPAEAFEAFSRAAALDGGEYDTLCNLGMALAAMGRHEDALARFDAAVARAPDAPLGHWRRSLTRLSLGDFAGGWDDYEHRWRTRVFTAKAAGYVTPAMQGRLALWPTPADFAGRRVAVIAEQGVGDQIMFASILPDLAAVAAGVTVICDPRLVGLFAASFEAVEVIGPAAAAARAVGDFEVVVALGSLAAAFRRDRAAFPGEPYLRPRTPTVEAWRSRLGPAQGRRRIGVSWRGGGANASAGARSMTLETLRPLLTRPDCEFVSLQYGEAAADVAAANARLPRPIVCFEKAEIDDFEQLAGLVCALDEVVSVQTAVIHLAGALGQPCRVMVPKRPEWRYGLAGEVMPWYGSVRLFRQGETEEWPAVVARVDAALTDSRSA